MRLSSTSYGRSIWRASVSGVVLLVGCMACGRSAPANRLDSVTAPRYPRYLVNPSGERLLQAARLAVRQTAGRTPLGVIQSGQKVYVLIQYGQDMDVFEVVRKAWAERGVEAHAVGFWDLMGISKDAYYARMKPQLVYGDQAWKELGVFRAVYKPFFPPAIQQQFGEPMTDDYVRRTYGTAYLDKHPEIQRFFAGKGGGVFWERALGPEHAKKFMGNWIYIRPIDLVQKVNEFPGDLWSLVDDKIVRPVASVSEVVYTDLQGTRLHFTLTRAQSAAWAKSSGSSGHLNIYPSPLASTLTEGIVRATANHTAFFPTMTVHLSPHGKVTQIDGGGKTGELFKMLVDHPKMKDARFPSAPEPGYWFLTQDGFGTNPKFVRNIPVLLEGDPYLPNDVERNRAGVQHFSFSHPGQIDDPRDQAYAREQGLPLEHTAHMHSYFSTVKWRLADTGEWLTISENGFVNTFDDPEVRALAARYGDPSLVLRYEWVPDIPGVNIPGDYDRDYGADPWKWILAQWNKIQNGSYAYYIDDYTLQAIVAK